MSLRLFKLKKKVKKIFSGMVCCTGWTEYIFLVWPIVALAETKVFSYYPKWKVSQDENNIFFPPQESSSAACYLLPCVLELFP